MPKKYILTLLVIAIVFFGGIYMIINIITGGRKASNTSVSSSPTSQKKFSDNAREVKYTVYGKVVSDEDRRAIRISINNTERKIEVLQGYDERVISTSSTANTPSAYRDFLLALQGSGFNLMDVSSKLDEKTVCPLGKKYVFESQMYEGASFRSWTNSCATKGTTFKGNISTVDLLFKSQVPNYSKITQSVVL